MDEERQEKDAASAPPPEAAPRNAAAAAPPLGLRRAPVQARGRATFDRILDTTATLLDEVGIERISTNLIARRAGINIATLYKYFPNKLSVINALFEHQIQQRTEYSRAAVPESGHQGDWRTVVDTVVDALFAARRRQPGNTALRRAMLSSPELRQIHDAMNRETAGELAVRIAARQRVAGEAAEVTARCAIEMLSGLLDLAEGEAEPARTLVQAEAKRALKAYLAHCFED
ncbi:TetR/AcrR family transcriptional regulator [Cupriavidus respiraculi]|uniref:TetR/AcrR family transcriptional regulator n=1 Tax=Cupriavidus respiraculi TaxID=195930 RepID=UPI001C9645F9|nr:TetR/AcrR family transcriptional regulator [Cupriavidus respiraculi]MBY4948793.1 TetR/AcrR family transcriptional regulator [Cupriavidus respiraculi]